MVTMTNFIQNVVDEKTISLLGKEKMTQLLSSLQDLDKEFSSFGESEMKQLVDCLRTKVCELAK
ncbi:hypothetical protein FSBG_00773 [Fusobacterium gonidiaformans 3-1-5R]|uniref:Uncharacterized protein n=1 Tax=Fusobacterium gonidiaformans 3-1-5R TaxID=469605 RepID=E5BE00_9FUSO|nr:hypothetical protein FSBG_00773 [Fusobacterium gonidiaformans 3-1-5R]